MQTVKPRARQIQPWKPDGPRVWSVSYPDSNVRYSHRDLFVALRVAARERLTRQIEPR